MNAVRWQTPRLSLDEDDLEQRLSEEHREALEALREQARAEGYRMGRESGLAAAGEQIDEQLALLESLVHSLSAPCRDLNHAVFESMVQLAAQMAEQLAGEQLRVSPNLVLTGVHDALAMLADDSVQVRITLAPEDAAALRQMPGFSELGAAWTIVEESSMQRGDCEVLTGATRIDAGVQARLRAMVAELLEHESVDG